MNNVFLCLMSDSTVSFINTSCRFITQFLFLVLSVVLLVLDGRGILFSYATLRGDFLPSAAQRVSA
jgi:hypothetical protein